MGNSSTKESRPPSQRSRASSMRSGGQQPTSPIIASPSQAHADRQASTPYTSRTGRGSRPDLSFLHLGHSASDRTATPVETKRETKQEREARRAEKERVAREKERERSVREESVDGGFLVTLGTYTGPEDYSKPVVRQLMIERRLAPFWKGLNDHNEAWTEHQLVAAARGWPIPPPDAIPPDMERSTSQASNNGQATDGNTRSLMVPISSRSQSYQSDTSANLSGSHPAFSQSGGLSPSSASTNAMPLFRARAKTLASLGSSSKSTSAQPMVPLEIQLPKDPFVNGQPVEAYMYKDAAECPICFLYYPPYLNKTRCCDQPICSECFVQIKRPDPHAPEHHDDPGAPPPEPKPQEEEALLVSEPSACPFCVAPEFGVTFEPPPFRRGLAYAGQASGHPLTHAPSAMSSSSSLTSTGANTNRRRTTSLSANASTVITTDRVRPDWAKKLSDARATALRRSAAATALHNAAYVLGNVQGADARSALLGRRRRTLFGEGASPSEVGTPTRDGMPINQLSALLALADRPGGLGDADLYPGRTSSRRSRANDLEELMMMEAIRLSLAAEEDRKKKEEKESKKDAKKKAKEDKKAEKAARKSGASLYPASANESTSTWTSMTRSSSNVGLTPSSPTPPQGKGKAPAMTSSGFNPLNEPTSTLNTEMAGRSGSAALPMEDAQRHLEESRANIQPPSQPIAFSPGSTPNHRSHLRQMSNASSASSSLHDSAPTSLHNEAGYSSSQNVSGLDVSNSQSGTPSNGATPSLEPMFNFRSLAAMIGKEGKQDGNADHVEHMVEGDGQVQPALAGKSSLSEKVGGRSRGNSAGSTGGGGSGRSSLERTMHSSGNQATSNGNAKEYLRSVDEDAITPLRHETRSQAGNKHIGDVRVSDAREHEAAQ